MNVWKESQINPDYRTDEIVMGSKDGIEILLKLWLRLYSQLVRDHRVRRILLGNCEDASLKFPIYGDCTMITTPSKLHTILNAEP